LKYTPSLIINTHCVVCREECDWRMSMWLQWLRFLVFLIDCLEVGYRYWFSAFHLHLTFILSKKVI
jgi:hypothetical protein